MPTRNVSFTHFRIVVTTKIKTKGPFNMKGFGISPIQSIHNELELLALA